MQYTYKDEANVSRQDAHLETLKMFGYMGPLHLLRRYCYGFFMLGVVWGIEINPDGFTIQTLNSWGIATWAVLIFLSVAGLAIIADTLQRRTLNAAWIGAFMLYALASMTSLWTFDGVSGGVIAYNITLMVLMWADWFGEVVVLRRV
jgi:hypothetical protein